MVRKFLTTILVIAAAVTLASCSAASENVRRSEVSVLFAEKLPDTTEAHAIEETLSSEDDIKIVDPTGGVVPTDDDYQKPIPSQVNSSEVPYGDTSYKDHLEDKSLLKLADKYYSEGYYVVDAETLASNGAFFTIDGSGYFYRGFMAALYGEEGTEIRYYFIISEEQLFELVGQYDEFTSGFTDNDEVVHFLFEEEGVELNYYRDTGIMEYIFWNY